MSPNRIAFATVLVALGLPGVAHAHVAASPASVPAGEVATIALAVSHGCEESPTTRLTVRLPEGSASVAPRRVAGWTASERTVAGVTEVSWSGGSLPSAQAQRFRLRVALGGRAGETAVLKTVQRCTSGQTNWVELPRAGQAEPESPAPTVRLSAGEPAQDRPAALRASAAATQEGGGLAGPSIAGLIAGGLLLAGGLAALVSRAIHGRVR